MAFDAGTIDARLTLDPSAFNRDFTKVKADVKKFEDEGHKVKISAVFDSGSVTRARKMFSDLDNAISRDAMNRLKSSPQGSVLGSLNALFSPHPVTGAPSPSQSAEGGLLGKMLSPEASGGGGYSSGSGSPLGNVLSQTADTTDNIRQNLVGAGASDVDTTDSIRQALTGQGATNTTTTDDIKQALIGQGATNTTTTDDIKQALVGKGAQNTTTTDTIKQALVGNAPGNVSTTDTIKERLDPKSTGDVEKAAEDSGGRAGGRWTVGFGAHLGPFFASFHKKLGDEGTSGGAAMGSGLLGGIGPGILGIGMKMSLMVGAIGSALAVLPAVAGLIGVGMGVAMIGGLLAVAIKGNAKLSAQFKALGGDFTSTISKAVAPVVPIISKAIGSLAPMIKSLQGPLAGIFKTIAPQLQGIFSGLGPIIKGLLSVMQAAAPAFGPFIKAIESLVGNLLPGIATVIKATTPFISQFAGILGSLGGSLGQLFATAAPAIGASMKILGGLLGLVGDLLPIIMNLAGIFADTLAPVFSAFAGVVQTLLPILTLIGQVIAEFAGAVLGDLGSAFGAVAALIQAIGPGLSVLAKAFGSIFTVLENSGVFAELGDALENIATPLGTLIGLLIKQFAPILPPIIGLIGGLAGIVVELVSAGLAVLIGAVTSILKTFPFLVPLIGAITGAWIAWNLVMDANPIGAILLAIVALIGGIDLLITHWSQVWGAVKQIASDVGGFLDNLFHNQIVQDILAIWSLGLIPLAEHWTAVWGDIRTVASDAARFFTATWGDIESGVKTAWNAITAFLTGWWNSETAAFRADLATVKALLSAAWSSVTATVRSAWNAISSFFTGWWSGEVAAFRNVGGTIEAILASAWNAMSATVRAVWGDILAYIRGIPGQVTGALGPLGGDLRSLGGAVFGDMLAGIKAGASGIVSWLQGFAKDVIGVFKSIWGWFSPSTVMYAGGKALMDGLAGGIKDHAHQAVAQATSVAGKVTAGVAQWKGLVLQALKMEGLSASLVGNVLYQMQTESGGNQAAINLTDINAQEGDPSRGLMQVIGTTFSEYHWPGTSGNIYDPLANIAAALNYARNVYGPTLMDGGMGIGSGHGYALGGAINEPIIGYGVNSGRRYTFGEAGPEWVTPGGGPPGSDPALLARLDQLIAATRQIPAGVGNTVGGAIGGASHAASFRSRYPRGGA